MADKKPPESLDPSTEWPFSRFGPYAAEDDEDEDEEDDEDEPQHVGAVATAFPRNVWLVNSQLALELEEEEEEEDDEELLEVNLAQTQTSLIG